MAKRDHRNRKDYTPKHRNSCKEWTYTSNRLQEIAETLGSEEEHKEDNKDTKRGVQLRYQDAMLHARETKQTLRVRERRIESLEMELKGLRTELDNVLERLPYHERILYEQEKSEDSED